VGEFTVPQLISNGIGRFFALSQLNELQPDFVLVKFGMVTPDRV